MKEYFSEVEKEAPEDQSEDPIYKGYKNVLDSKPQDETLVSSYIYRERFLRINIVWVRY